MFLKTTFIEYHGARLEIPLVLRDIWPHELPLSEWPTFCGAGEGIGDVAVPDEWYLGFIHISPACFIHDICWALTDNSDESFDWANDLFRRNLKALIDAQLWWPFNRIAYGRCDGYYLAVQTFGKLCFEHEYIPGQHHIENITVKSRLAKLDDAVFIWESMRG